jgi:DNA-binding sugar fermentation-stimulating protein
MEHFLSLRGAPATWQSETRDCHAEFILRYARFFAALRMTGDEGLRMTGDEGLRMTGDEGLAMTVLLLNNLMF